MVAFGTLTFGIGAVSASSAINVGITSTVVTATGYNSASGGYYWTTGTFKNYNPVTGHWGVLEWNPKGTAEGEWTASDNDMDFSINGKCKMSTGWQKNIWLVKSSGVVTKKSQAQPVSSPSTGTNTGTDITTDGTILGDIIGQLNNPFWSL